MPLPKSLSRMSDLAQGFRSEDWRDSLPLWVSAGLVLLLAWQLVQLLWTAISDGPAAIAPAPEAGPTAPAGPPIHLQGIVNAHLFGVAPVPGASELDPSAAPATQMSLVLVGTIAQSDPGKGFAIIGESAPTAKLVAVGKTVTGGTRLHSVYADRVILDRGGKLEALMLPKKFEGGRGAPRGATGATAMRSTQPMLGDQIRTLATQNPGAITEILRPQPVFANGQQRGYRVYPGRNRQQFSRLGLMPGDLVTAINGTPLDDPARGMEILQSINSASEVTVTIERNGQSSQVSINNAQVAADAAAAAAAAEQADSMPVEELEADTVQDDEESTE